MSSPLFENQAFFKPNQIQSFPKRDRFFKFKLHTLLEHFFSSTFSSSLGACLFASYFCKGCSSILSLSKGWFLDKFYLSCFQAFISDE